MKTSRAVLFFDRQIFRKSKIGRAKFDQPNVETEQSYRRVDVRLHHFARLQLFLQYQTAMSEAEGGAKPSFFGKMYNFVKTVAERAMDPDAIPSDDENGNDSDNDNGGDAEAYTVDFRQKFVPGNTVKVEFDSAQDTASAPVQNDPVDELNVDALAIESSELELELETASADASPPATEEAPGSKGFVGRSTGVSFCTRVGPNYKVNKQKAPSAPALMELMSAE
jgi:hypothetical protein